MKPLFTYRCSFCKTTAASTLRISQPPLKCAYCLRIMAFLYTMPISDEEWRARDLNPPVFTSAHAVNPERAGTRRCDTCRDWCDRGDMIALAGVGKFCSQFCTDAGVADHEKFMQRISKLRHEMPWLYTDQKASA